MKKPLSKFKCIYIETNLDSSRLQVLYTDGITITEHVSHSLIKHWHEEIERVVHSMTKYSGERHTPFIVLSFLFWPKLSLSRTTAEMISESWVTCSGLSPITHICRAASIQTVTCVSHMLWILLSGCTGTHFSLLHYWSLLVLRRGIRLCIYQEDYAILTR